MKLSIALNICIVCVITLVNESQSKVIHFETKNFCNEAYCNVDCNTKKEETGEKFLCDRCKMFFCEVVKTNSMLTTSVSITTATTTSTVPPATTTTSTTTSGTTITTKKSKKMTPKVTTTATTATTTPTATTETTEVPCKGRFCKMELLCEFMSTHRFCKILPILKIFENA